jgi:phosphatidylglycerophosphate synthase
MAGRDRSAPDAARPIRVPGAVHVVLVGPRPERLAAQLAGLAARRPIAVELADSAALPNRVRDAAANRHAFAAIDTAVVVPDEALLRIVDDPTLRLATLVRRGAGPHPVATDGSIVLSSATAWHPVPGGDGDAVGVVYVRAAVAGAVAERLDGLDPALAALDPIDLLLVALVRDAALPPVTAVALDPLPGGRAADAEAVTALASDVGQVDAADLASRTAARTGDGFYSTFVLRRIAARVTPWAVRRGIQANAVTVLSALIGVAGAVSFAFGTYPALVLGALLLQVSIVLDCVDGEIARVTRTRSPFGAWLDAATDRLKEYAALAGLAIGAGPGWWWVATAGMVVQTARHMHDFAFAKGVLAAYRRARERDTRSLSDTSPWKRAAGSQSGESGSASMWVRRVIHMPIGERWLVLSVAALLNAPGAGLVAYLALAVLSGGWTLLGALRRNTSGMAESGTVVRRTLADYRDDGVLLPFTTGRRPGGVLGWLLPSALTVAEGAVLVGLTQAVAADWAAAAFLWFAVVAWHRYDVVYRRGGETPMVPSVVSMLGGGWPARIAALLLGAAFGVLPAVLVAGTIWMTLVYVPESLATGVRTRRIEAWA